MSTIPSKDQQIDALWKAMQAQDFWVAVDFDGRMRLLENKSGETGLVVQTFEAPTREEVIAQLIAFLTAERLS